MTTENLNLPKYLTVNEWCKKHSWPPEGGIRHLIYNAEDNGFCKVIRRSGRRILINEEAFFQWIEEQNQKNKTETSNSKQLA